MQALPRVTVDRSTINTYLSTKNYNASFVVAPQAGSDEACLLFRGDKEFTRIFSLIDHTDVKICALILNIFSVTYLYLRDISFEKIIMPPSW